MSSMMSRGSQQTINKTPIENGKIRFAIDTGRLFFDTVYQRIEITDFIKGLKYSEILALEFPLPKVYLSSDTHHFLSYDFNTKKWIILSAPPESTVTDIKYYKDQDDPDAKENICIIYADGNSKIIESSRIEELENRIDDLEKIVAKYVETIEILERQIEDMNNQQNSNDNSETDKDQILEDNTSVNTTENEPVEDTSEEIK